MHSPLLSAEHTHALSAGDAVVAFAVKRAMLRRHPQLSPGQLSPFFQRVTKGSALAAVARSLPAAQRIECDPTQRDSPAVLETWLEACVGAIAEEASVERASLFVETFIVAPILASANE